MEIHFESLLLHRDEARVASYLTHASSADECLGSAVGLCADGIAFIAACAFVVRDVAGGGLQLV